jgi:flagellin
MSSINTNASAMTALKSLQMTNKALETTQSRISTGYRVASASDNAAYWSIATTMRSDNKALSTVKDALGLGQAKLVAAKEPGVDKSKIQSEITQLQDQLTSIATSASFSGENWLSVDSSATGYSATKSVVASFNRAADGTVSVSTIDIDTSSTKLFDAATDAAAAGTGILDGRYDAATGLLLADQSTGGFTVSTLDISALTNSTADQTTLTNYIKGVDNALKLMTTSASDLGAAKSRVSMQADFVSDLMDAIDRGVGTLVDADMNEESTRLQALQVQQQLGIQALSIANSNQQQILSLFR